MRLRIARARLVHSCTVTCTNALEMFILVSPGKTEHVNDMVYSVEKLNSLVSAARVDLEAFKAREHHHRKSKTPRVIHRTSPNA